MRSAEFVSVKELAVRLSVAPATLTSVGVRANVLVGVPSDRALPLALVPELLAAFRRAHARTHEGWEIPRWLAGSDDPLERVLAEVYAEPMTRPASLPPSHGRQLRELVVATTPARVVEIGSFLGISTLWIASALRELGGGHVHAVDTFAPKLPFASTHCGCIVDPLEFVAAAVTRAGVSRLVSLHRMRSHRFAREFRGADHDGIDFLFIDGDHSIGGCLDDFATYYPLVRRGGYVLLHDIYPEQCGWKGPRYLIDHFLVSNPAFEVREIQTEPDYGMALVTKLADERELPAFDRMRAAMIRYSHRSVQALGAHRVVQRALKPLLLDWKLRRAHLV